MFSIFFFLSLTWVQIVHSMEIRDGKCSSEPVTHSTALYDVDELNACETFESIIALLVAREQRAFEDIRKYYKISDDVWRSEVIHPIKQFKDLAKQYYSTPPFFPPRRDPRVPKEVVKMTEHMLMHYNMSPKCVDITYDQRFFAHFSTAAAYARAPQCSRILGRPDFWSNALVSYNVKSLPAFSKSESDFGHTVAHEVIHMRDIHRTQKRLVEYSVVKQMGLTSLMCYYSTSLENVCSQAVYKKLCKVHETMAEVLPLLECSERRAMIHEVFNYYAHWGPSDDDGTHPTQEEIVPILTKISAIVKQHGDL